MSPRRAETVGSNREMIKNVIATLLSAAIIAASAIIWHLVKYQPLIGDWTGSYQCSLKSPDKGKLKWTIRPSGNFSYVIDGKYKRLSGWKNSDYRSVNSSIFGREFKTLQDSHRLEITEFTKNKIVFKYIGHENCETGKMNRKVANND